MQEEKIHINLNNSVYLLDVESQDRCWDENLQIPLPENQNIKLHKSKNPWKPSHKLFKRPEEDTEVEDLLRKIRSILNKLTPQNIRTLVKQLIELPIDTMNKLEETVNLIYERIVYEPNFCVPYTNMCKQIALKVPRDDAQGTVTFRKLLITKCQKEFIKYRGSWCTSEKEKYNELPLALEEKEKKRRLRKLGNVRFIGELLKQNMLIVPILHGCIKELLALGDEESLECLCQLLKTTGKELYDDGIKSHNWITFDSYFVAMQKIIDERLISSRIRFLLQDIIDLKENNWIPRKDESNPKTIDEIHQEAEKEAPEAERGYQNTSYLKCLSDDRRKISFGDINFFNGLKDMLLNSKFSDFVLNIKGKEFRVHRNILAARSPVFEAMFDHDMKEKKTNNANIEDCEPEIFSEFLTFLYVGEIDLNSDNALNLYEMAEKYQVIELSNLCEKYMIENISVENFVEILAFGLRHHVKKLVNVATKCFLQDSKEIAVTDKWITFLTENPVAGNELILKALSFNE